MHTPSMSIVEVMAELHDRGASVQFDTDSAWRIVGLNDKQCKRLFPHVRAYQQELNAIVLYSRRDGIWPFPRYEEGMCIHDAHTLLRRLVAEVEATPGAANHTFWRHYDVPNDTHVIEVLYCEDGCIDAAIDDTWRDKFWQQCSGDRLRLYSLHGWLTRPEHWKEKVRPI
jgi:hypothetical protein